MTQRAQIIDITKTYLPGDPNSFVQNLVNTDREDGEEKSLPVMPYEGYNFLPTNYGYKSFFGTNAKLNIAALGFRAQWILLYQLPSFKNRMIALCEDGIWVCTPDGTYGTWVQVVTHSFDPAIYEEWTWCVIENILYMYLQGGSVVYKTEVGTWTIPAALGGLIGDPTTYQTFTLTEGSTGSATDFWASNMYDVFVQYTDGVDFSLEGTIASGFVASTNNVSFDIDVSGTAPTPATTARIIIYDYDVATYYYQDFLLSGFPISIPDLTSFTITSGFEAQTLVETIPETILSNDLTITSFTPSFLSMAGQMGIFKAGTRLGMWDSANSVSWSSNLDLSDFTPSIENLAGNTIFGDVIGRIVTCHSHGDGFVVYSTKSVVGARFTVEGNLLWETKKVLDSSGISHSHAITVGKDDNDHFFFGTTGIYNVGKYNPLEGKYTGEAILPELYDYLKESRDPVYLTVLEDRYLCFSLISSDYIYGKQSFYTGATNPYLLTVDWYIPSNDYPTPTYKLLPDQVWEIIKSEMAGVNRAKREGEWVPLYTTTVDIMDDRYYSFWRNWIGEKSTRLDYNDYSTYFNSIPVNLTSGDITTYIDAARPGSPPDIYRYGEPRTSTGIRAFWGYAGGDEKENNEALVYGQESEWDAYVKHATANKERLEAYTNVEETIVTSTPVLTTGGTNLSVTWGLPNSGNGTWTVSIGIVEIASGTWSYVSTLVDNIATLTVTNWPSWGTAGVGVSTPSKTSAFGWQGGKLQTFSGVTQWSGSSGWINGAWEPTQSSGTWSELTLVTSPANSDITTPVPTVIGTFITGKGSNEWLTSEGTSNYAAREIILRRTFNKAYEVTKHVSTRVQKTYTAVGSNVSLTTVTTVTTTYTVAEVTGSYGYSQYRALVTQWDRIKFGLYGNFEVLESRSAETFTPKVFDGHYPAALQADVDKNVQLWSYSVYSAKKSINLTTGEIAGNKYVPPDTGATGLLTIDGYNSEGITSAHTSYTLPGASFLMQTGSIEAAYPTFTGAIVLDMQLKKWGKYKGVHKILLESTPANAAIQGTVTYSDLGANAGILNSAGEIRLFDSQPADSWIRWGKIGFYRLGMSNLLEVKAQMRYASDFKIITETSLDGKMLDSNSTTWNSYNAEVIGEHLPDVIGRWHTVRISGNYDLTGLEIRATIAGRR